MNNPERDDFEDEKVRWDFKNLRESGISFKTRLLLRVSPLRGIKSLSRELGVDPDIAEKAHAAFEHVKRIDILPGTSGERGFQIIIDGSTALYFCQDGDHFVYDGFENGEYEKGEVTVFDT